ncbi:MAG: SDR family NAD(P)-dependent oxidoreductase, partial [Solirubrobacterales bacterium]|nr:SDR family NAD(P)-dependent oxidoreductase [Solirubrobacterales bacterium]
MSLGSMSLEGRAAVVTGAASGIGRAVAARLEQAGMSVLAVDLDPDPEGPGASHRADLTEPAANAGVVDARPPAVRTPRPGGSKRGNSARRS